MANLGWGAGRSWFQTESLFSVTQRPLLVHALHAPAVTHRYQWLFVLSFLFLRDMVTTA